MRQQNYSSAKPGIAVPFSTLRIFGTFTLALDWAIAILSPAQSQTKVTKNILHGFQHGTQMGWLIDPAERSVFVYCSHQPITYYEELETQLPVPAFAQEFNLTVGCLFGWLME